MSNSISTCEESKTDIEKQNLFRKYRSKSNLADIKIRIPKFPVHQSSLFFEFGTNGCAPPCSGNECGWFVTARESMARERTGFVAGKSRDCNDGRHGFTSKTTAPIFIPKFLLTSKRSLDVFYFIFLKLLK